MANRFFVGDVDADYNDAGNWASTSGGSGGAGIPTSADDVFYDANSPNCDLDATPNILTVDFTGYTAIIDGTAMLRTMVVGGDATLSPIATYTRFDLSITDASATVDFNGATIRIFQINNSTGSNFTVIFTSSPILVTVVFSIGTTSTGTLDLDAGTNNPDITITGTFSITESTGTIGIDYGSGTWTYNGSSYDLTGMTGNHNASTSTLIINVADANFTWFARAGQEPFNLIVNFDQATNREFNVTNPTSTTLNADGRFEIHILGAGDLEIDWLTYVCPDGFISEETSTGTLTVDGGTEFTAITCRAGTGTNLVDLRGLSTVTLISILTIGDASYTLRPGDVPLNLPSFVSTLLTSTTRTITVELDSFVVSNHWDIDFTDNASCDPLIVIFTNCEYVGNAATYQTVNNKNAATTFDLDMGNANWQIPINLDGPGPSFFSAGVDTLTGTTGIVTFICSANATDFDMRTELNDVVITGGGTITWLAGAAQTINGDLTIEVTTAGVLVLDYNTAEDFEVIGDFLMRVNGGAGSATLNMGTGIWKFGGDFTTAVDGAIVLTPETATVQFNGAATQTVTFNSKALTNVVNLNTSLATVIFNDAVNFDTYTSDADTLDKATQFKDGVTHNIDVITLTGSGAFRNIIRSTTLGATFTLQTNSLQSVDHVDVRDSIASTNTIDAQNATNDDSGNTTGWIFGFVEDAQIVEFDDIATVTGSIFNVTVNHSLELAPVESAQLVIIASVSQSLEIAPVHLTSGTIHLVTVDDDLEFPSGQDFVPNFICVVDSIVERDSVVFWHPFAAMDTKLVLPRPQFGDSHVVNTRVTIRHTRGGTRRTYNQGPVFEVMNMQFVRIGRTLRDEIIAFAKLSRSEEIRVLDHENRTWRAILASSPVILTSVGRIAPGGEEYTVNLSYEGEILT